MTDLMSQQTVADDTAARLIKVRFGPLCGLTADICRCPKSARSRHSDSMSLVDWSAIAGCRKRLQREVALLMSACWPAIAYSRVGTGRTPSEVLSSSNFPASHLGLELPLIAQSYRAFSIFAHPHSSNASFAGGWALFSAGCRWCCQQFRLQISLELFDCSTDQGGSLSISGC